MAWHDRWRNWREERAERRAEIESQNLAEADATLFEPAQAESRPSRFASFFRRRDRAHDRYQNQTSLEDIPAFQRPPMPAAGDEEAAEIAQRKASIWERSAGDASAAGATAVPVQPHAPTPDPWAEARATHPEPVRVTARAAEPAPAARRTTDPIAIHGRADAEIRTVTVAPKSVSGFKLPPSTLLHTGDAPIAVKEDSLREEARVLVEKCGEFDVRGQVVQINTGPMVTTYEFKPEAGVKYSRVTGLADDLCLAMRAESILIERMPGKSTVGIQVPNHDRETIHLRDVLESEVFARAKGRLTIAMGKDINGRIVPADLATMPHLLIAGSTGSGKSVAINAMIMSLLFRTTPAQVRLILVDPKRVELGMYEGIPHLLTPIITEPKLAANALRNAVREMERRLKLLASRSVRNIDQYNKLFEGSMPSLFEETEDNEPLPFIVIIIDELADLMMLDRANVEESITRLAQMARAVGIHLVLATQRPSVDVITGLIKANVRPRRHALPAARNQPPHAPARSIRQREGNSRCGGLLERPGPGRICAGLPRVAQGRARLPRWLQPRPRRERHHVRRRSQVGFRIWQSVNVSAAAQTANRLWPRRSLDRPDGTRRIGWPRRRIAPPRVAQSPRLAP